MTKTFQELAGDLITDATREHVDDFIDAPNSKHDYARWFFAIHRFPAFLSTVFAPFMSQYRLYCTFEGKRWRVVGASRLGDIYLKDPAHALPDAKEWSPFYDKRSVHTNQVTDWSDKE